MTSELLMYGFDKLVRSSVTRDATDRLVEAILRPLFGQQLGVINDPSREKSVLCPRRAGKTTLVSSYLVTTALTKPRSISRYWAISQRRAKQLMWEPIRRINQDFGLGLTDDDFNGSENTVKFPNGSEIRIVGADKEKEIHKKRGDGTSLEIVDECQAMGDYIKPLVEDVIGPSLLDRRGTLCLMGTPGVVKAGFWYGVTGLDAPPSAAIDGFSRHSWKISDNVALPHLLGDALELKRKRGWGDDHPTWRREYLGEWVDDAGALFYKFSNDRNLHRKPIEELCAPGWMHSLGWDIGWNDDMALVIWAWHPRDRILYEAFSWKKSHIITDDVMSVINSISGKLNIVKQVVDTGGIGKVVAEEVRKRFGMHFEPAKKTEKYEHAMLMSDDLTAGRIKLRDGSPLHLEMSVLPSDPDSPEGGGLKEDPRYPNHCCDAGLYAWRGARHWLYEPEEIRPRPGTEGHDRMIEEEMLRVTEEEHFSQKEWWEQ